MVRPAADTIRAELALIAGRRGSKPLVIDEPQVKIKPKAKKRKNSRVKGSSYERKIALGLMGWFGGVWKRTPLSGGWSKGSDYGVSGDLVCTLKNPFHIECKHREQWQLDDLITGTRARGTCSLMDWWEQACREAPRSPKKKWPILIFHRNRGGHFVMLREEHFARLDKGGTAQFIPAMRFYMEGLEYGTGHVVILSLKDLFKKVRPPKSSPNYKTWEWTL